MLTLYPAIKPYAEHQLQVDDLHNLYIAECGNPKGRPVLVVHSGPGGGCHGYHRCFFDPDVYRIILFDQRGAGRSKPHVELRNNTTQDLIQDMDKIRAFLEIDQWFLFGGSWGAALSLLYAETFPHHVLGMILHRLFLARDKDIKWFYQQGANLIFPDYWQEFIQNIPQDEHNDLVAAYYKRLTGVDELARMSAAKSWSLWQARCASLQPHHDLIDHFSEPYFAISLACIESHYLVNHCFIEENVILNNLDKIQHIPAYIIHGRYDMVCPLYGAWELHQAWPLSELYIIRDAGHSTREPGIIDALVLATQQMAKSTTKPAC